MGGGGGCRGGRWADRQMERDTNTEDLFRWAVAFHEGLQTDDLASRKTYYSRWYGERVTEKESEKGKLICRCQRRFTSTSCLYRGRINTRGGGGRPEGWFARRDPVTAGLIPQSHREAATGSSLLFQYCG